AESLGIDADFVVGTIAGASLEQPPEVVLALHVCDTATDEALARAVEWEAPLVLAAPCCHHDVAAQLRKAPTPTPYAMLTRHGILRERFADTLTDALRASILRILGYRVDVVEFVESEHTPRNTMLRAVRTGSGVKGGANTGGRRRKEYDDLVATWAIRPRLAELVGLG
ncbi:MAG TPA: methyltransferase, partial [Nocardioides sp.]